MTLEASDPEYQRQLQEAHLREVFEAITREYMRYQARLKAGPEDHDAEAQLTRLAAEQNDAARDLLSLGIHNQQWMQDTIDRFEQAEGGQAGGDS